MYLVTKRVKGQLLSAKVATTLLKAQEAASSLLFRNDLSRLFRREMNAVLTYSGASRLTIEGVTIEPITE